MINEFEKLTYDIKGLNLKKFLKTLSLQNIAIKNVLKQQEYNHFTLSIYKKDERRFLSLAKQFNYELNEIKLPFIEKMFRLFKTNIIFFVVSIIIFCMVFVTNNYIFKVDIIGLENVSKEEVESVLNENGFEKNKLKSSYNLDSIESVLTLNINKISFASAVIKGNTLIVNVNEKIDNSDYIYNYPPIISPCDCIIKEITLLSGTVKINKNQTAKKGDVIVSPYICYENSVKLPVPAKAKITAYVEFNLTKTYLKDDYTKNFEKYIVQNEKELYNKLSDTYNLSEFESSYSEVQNQGNVYLINYLKGNITF